MDEYVSSPKNLSRPEANPLAGLFSNSPKDEKLMIVRNKSELDKVEKVKIIIVSYCKILSSSYYN
jgi:hypothetical protein